MDKIQHKNKSWFLVWVRFFILVSLGSGGCILGYKDIKMDLYLIYYDNSLFDFFLTIFQDILYLHFSRSQ